jgi:hypothetical protein
MTASTMTKTSPQFLHTAPILTIIIAKRCVAQKQQTAFSQFVPGSQREYSSSGGAATDMALRELLGDPMPANISASSLLVQPSRCTGTDVGPAGEGAPPPTPWTGDRGGDVSARQTSAGAGGRAVARADTSAPLWLEVVLAGASASAGAWSPCHVQNTHAHTCRHKGGWVT